MGRLHPNQNAIWRKRCAWIPVLALLTALWAPGASAAEYERAARGKELATQMCAKCHAVEKTGSSPHQDAPPFRTLASRWPLDSLEEALAEGIVTGHPDMPPYEFEPEDISALLDHLHVISEKPAAKTK